MSFLGCCPPQTPSQNYLAGLGQEAGPVTSVVNLLAEVIKVAAPFIPESSDAKKAREQQARIAASQAAAARSRAGQAAKTVGTLALAGVAVFALYQIFGKRKRKPRRRRATRKRTTRRRRRRR